MRDFRDAKAMAHALRGALKARAVDTTHSECLELVAKAFGYENWNVLAAKIDTARLRAAASAAAGAPDSGEQETLHCSFCGKSQHDVQKLIAGPAVYICDGCVKLCTEIVSDQDPLSKVLGLLAEDEAGGADGDGVAAEHFRSRSTEDVAALVARCRQFADHNRRLAQCIRRKLTIGPEDNLAEDDVLTSREFAFLSQKTKDELLALERGATMASKRGDVAVRIGTSVLAERQQ
jgi:hypothetical protein